jgi:hypothetical protein
MIATPNPTLNATATASRLGAHLRAHSALIAHRVYRWPSAAGWCACRA